jgi:hypothetical protein
MGSATHLKAVFLAVSPKASTTIFGNLFSAATEHHWYMLSSEKVFQHLKTVCR